MDAVVLYLQHTQPPMVVCKMEAQSEHLHVASSFFCIVCSFVRMLSRCLLTEISASEFSRKFIKSALMVGSTLPVGAHLPAVCGGDVRGDHDAGYVLPA